MTSLRVMTWNIHKGVGGVDRRYDLSRTIAVLEAVAPDVVLLQEVAQGIPTLRGDDQVPILAETFNGYSAFHPEHQFRRGGYGNLILSRWPMDTLSHLDLTIGYRKTRGLLQAHIRTQIAGHQHTLVVHNLHLGLAGSERSKQLQRFIECDPFKRVHRNTALIIAGDLNDVWGSLGPKHLLPLGFRRAGPLAKTFPAAVPLRPLDGVFYRGELNEVKTYVPRFSLARTASDHLPLVSEFTFS